MNPATRKSIFIFAIAAVSLLAGCVSDSRKHILSTTESQVQLRSYQTRAFDTSDRNTTLRTVIATLQDLSFVIDKADEVLGTVSATKLDGYQLQMTVTVRPKGDNQMLVRANAQYNLKAVEDPEPYQNFFTSLEKAMFLTAHSVD